MLIQVTENLHNYNNPLQTSRSRHRVAIKYHYQLLQRTTVPINSPRWVAEWLKPSKKGLKPGRTCTAERGQHSLPRADWRRPVWLKPSRHFEYSANSITHTHVFCLNTLIFSLALSVPPGSVISALCFSCCLFFSKPPPPPF